MPKYDRSAIFPGEQTTKSTEQPIVGVPTPLQYPEIFDEEYKKCTSNLVRNKYSDEDWNEAVEDCKEISKELTMNKLNTQNMGGRSRKTKRSNKQTKRNMRSKRFRNKNKKTTRKH